MSESITEQQKQDWLRGSVLAAELDAQEVGTLAAAMEARQIADGESVVEEGDAARTLFVLAQGRLDVLHHSHGEDHVVYRMAAGECAGTRAFVDGSPRKAGLRAVGDSILLTLEPAAFETLLLSQPRLVFKVMRALFRITHSNLMRVNQESDALRNYVTRSHGRY